MDRIGVIDIGSNSVRLTLAEVEKSGYFKIIDANQLKIGTFVIYL